jgi:hypothetical protein
MVYKVIQNSIARYQSGVGQLNQVVEPRFGAEEYGVLLGIIRLVHSVSAASK